MPAILHTCPTVNSRSTTRLATLTSSSSSDCRLAIVPPSLANGTPLTLERLDCYLFLIFGIFCRCLRTIEKPALRSAWTVSGQRLRDLVEDRRVVDGGRHAVLGAGGDGAHRAAQDLPRAGLREARDDARIAEHGDRPDLPADELHELRDDHVVVAVDAGLQHHEDERYLAPELVRDADHGTFGDIGVRGEHLLHRAGREAVAGDVDHVVDPAHHEQ